jgi:RNA polymerase sigma-70 factor (ECF subfamily)
MPPFFPSGFLLTAHDPVTAQFTEAYERHANAVLRHCRFQIFDDERAKEIMQEAFMRTWEYLQAGKEISHMKTFLFRVANNLIVDDARRRKGKEQVSLEDLQEKGFDIGYEDIENTQQKVDVWRTMLHVKKKEYALLRMRYIEGMRPTDIAIATGLAPNTVAVRLHRTLKDIAVKICQSKRKTSVRSTMHRDQAAA